MSFSTVISSAVRSYFRRNWDLESLVNVINHDRPITPEILRHLGKMYLILFWISVSFGFGYHFGIYEGNIGHVGLTLFILWYPRIGTIGQGIRFYLMIFGAMLGGSLLGHCFRPFLVADFGVRVVIAAVMWTYAILVFSEAAQLRLSSLCDVLLRYPILGLINFIAYLIHAGDPYILMWNMIVWFVAYVAVFSRLLVQRIRDGDYDFVNHAITFFTDAPAVSMHMITLVFWGALGFLRDVAREAYNNYLERRQQRR